MMLTITLIISVLIAINFILLLVSCNKTTKKESIQKPAMMSTAHKNIKVEKPMKKLAGTTQLAPTGS